MDRTTLLDKILNHLFKEENGSISIDIWGEQNCGIDEYDPVYDSITKELIEREWVEKANFSKNILRLTNEGRQIIDKYGSYSSFIKKENEKISKIEKSKRTRHRVTVTLTIIAILVPIIFGLLNYINKEDIKKPIEKTHLEQKRPPINSQSNI